MSKRWLQATLYTGLFGVFLYFAIPIWLLFLVAAGYNWFRIAVPPPSTAKVAPSPQAKFGILGSYTVDEQSDDLSWGLYIQLRGEPVFIDIRKDHLLQAREHAATLLASSAQDLDHNLRQFIQSNSEFSNRRVASIGLHSDDLTRGEVFWEPDGYTVLLGKTFVKDMPRAF